MRKLLDFDVVIDSHGDGYRTRVVASPAGEEQANFVLPFTDEGLENFVLKVVRSIGGARRKVRRIQSEERRLLEDFGGQLFQAVFSSPVRECLGRSRMAAEDRDAGLRIRLRLPGSLANIPWEYLYDAEYGFLGLSPETALIRYVEMPAPVRPFPVSPPLRILAMISAPDDVPGLQGEEEWEKLKGALADLIRSGLVRADRLEAGTLAALQRPLRLREYHVLHFIGHGGYDEDAQDGALALEAADRTTRLVTGRDLGLMIRDRRSLRLVVLNACEGARGARDDPFGGVAQALVRQGIPAVIAMQFEISDPAALVFSQHFYQAIADGRPVDVATSEARLAMFAAGHEVEWATPVLYLRSPDGQVFTEGQISRAELEAREDAEPKTREAAERKAQQTAERKAQDEAARKVGDYAEPTAGEDAERIASEEAERKAKQKAKREAKRKAEDKGAKAFNRGSSLQARGNVVGAKAAYQQAIDSGPTVGAALAAVRLGELLRQRGDVAGAKAAYQRVIDSGSMGHMVAAPLGDLLYEQGDVAGAKAAYQMAIDSGQSHSAPMAAVGLGYLLSQQGDVAGAKAAYQMAIDYGQRAIDSGPWAIDSGHREWAPWAAADLGYLLGQQGDVAGARAAYQMAIDSGHPKFAPAAADRLKRLNKGSRWHSGP